MSEQKVKPRERGLDRIMKISIRVTEAERRKMEEQAKEEGLSLSEYIRVRSVPGRVHIKETTGRVVKPVESDEDD